jgi:hypothetical protein
MGLHQLLHPSIQTIRACTGCGPSWKPETDFCCDSVWGAGSHETTRHPDGLLPVPDPGCHAPLQVLVVTLNWGWTGMDVEQGRLVARVRGSAPSPDPDEKFLDPLNSGYAPFVGQGEAMDSLDAAFHRYQTEKATFACLIAGRTGIGKTSLAENFARRKEADITGKVIRIDVRGQDVGASIKDLAKYGAVTPQNEIGDQAQDILRQIPGDSILILDNVDGLSGHEVFARPGLRFFMILVSNAHPVGAIMETFAGRCERITLSELNEHECERLFKARLNEEIVKVFEQAGLALTGFLTTPVQRTPFFVRQVCRVIEELYFDDDVRDISDLTSQTREQISKETQGILEFLFTKISENPETRNLILACSLFSAGKIPYDQLAEVAGLSSTDAATALDRAVRLGWVNGPNFDADRRWFWMDDSHHEYACRQFRSQPSEIQNELKQAFVGTWFRVLAQCRNVQDLWAIHDPLVVAIRYLRQFEEPLTFVKGIEALDPEQILALQKVVPPKDRIDFYWTLLKTQNDQGKIAGILAALTESLLRAGNTAVAESFAQQSLRPPRVGDRNTF